jgi:hypothetical protein
MKRGKAAGWLYIAAGAAILVYTLLLLLGIWNRTADNNGHSLFILVVLVIAPPFGLTFSMCSVVGPLLVLRREPGKVTRGLGIAGSLILIPLGLIAIPSSLFAGTIALCAVLALSAIVIAGAGLTILIIMM